MVAMREWRPTPMRPDFFRVDIIGEARMEADVGARMVKDEGEASTSSNEDGGTGRTRKRAAPSPRGSQRSQLTNIAE
jgi:hypothetical protein